MNEELISRWNERVDIDDTVFVIGDFKFGSGGITFNELRKLLNGHKVFIRGNHDKNNGVKTIVEHAAIETFGVKILLVHDPSDAYKWIEDYDMAFVGHVHEKWRFRHAVVNVGVDVWDYYPVHAKQILKAYKTWKAEAI